MDWLEWLENSEDSSLISSCRLWTRREARCLYSWCIADSSSLIRGTCKNTTHHVIPRSWAAQLLGSQSTPEQNPLTLLPAAQSPAFYSFVLFAPGNSSRCGKCIHLTLTAFTENKSILKATSMAWMSLHRQTDSLFREWNTLSNTLAFPAKCVMYVLYKGLQFSDINYFLSAFKQEWRSNLYFSEKKAWLYAVKKSAIDLTYWSQQLLFCSLNSMCWNITEINSNPA